jgi:predicted kinase
VSGSGKSWLAERLVPRLGAVRVRSDVERKRLAALDPLENSGSKVDEGLYTARATDDLYRHLERCGGALLTGGERTIVDATFSSAGHRAAFRALAARHGAPCIVVHCVAPHAVLVERIERRNATAGDPSEATVAVLERQLSRHEAPTDDEPSVVTIDTRAAVDADAIAHRLESLLARN